MSEKHIVCEKNNLKKINYLLLIECEVQINRILSLFLI